MHLYFHPRSANSRRVLMTAIHLGVPLDRVPVAMESGGHRSPAFLQLNPNGKVPLLDDDGFLLWESHAIMAYLAERAPGQTLYPAEPRARADVNRWLFWCAYHFTPAVGRISRERVSKHLLGGGTPDMAAIAEGEASLREAARVLDAHLAGREWVAGKGLTLADFAIAAPLMHTERAALPVLDFAHLQAWFVRMQALDAWQATEPAALA